MKLFTAAVALALLAACGAETATTAATNAAIKKREVDEGKKTLERALDKIDQAMEQGKQRAERDDDK